jgi:serine/threonine-protein kinase SRPK3
LFTGRDPEHDTYRGRAHLSEMIALLGPPPPSLLARAHLRSKFFSVSQVLTPLFFEGNDSEANDTRLKGVFSAGIPIPLSKTLDDRETSLQGEQDREDRENFLRFMRKMLQWEPEKRSCARELAEDEWILKHTT